MRSSPDAPPNQFGARAASVRSRFRDGWLTVLSGKNMRSILRWSLALCLAFSVSCGKSDPTGPTPGPSAPTGVMVNAIDIVRGELTIVWTHSTGVDRWIVEAGSTPGASDLTSFSVPGGTSSARAVWTNVAPRRNIYMRVKAETAAGVGDASPDIRAEMPDMRHVTEALFFRTGPYTLPVQSRAAGRAAVGFPAGTRVLVRVPNSVVGAEFDGIVRAVQELNAAIGVIDLVVSREDWTRAQWEQQRPTGITIHVGEGACTQGGEDNFACWVPEAGAVRTRGQILVPTPNIRAETWAHELGHAVGLQHLDVNLNPDALAMHIQLFARYKPVMGTLGNGTFSVGSFPGLLFSELELDAVRRVYSAGLRPGNTIEEFIARGVVAP